MDVAGITVGAADLGQHETAAILRGMTPVIDEGELLAGKPCPRALTADEVEAWGDRLAEFVAGCADSGSDDPNQPAERGLAWTSTSTRYTPGNRR